MIEIRKIFAVILIFVILFFWFGLAAANDDSRGVFFETVSNNKMVFDVFIGKKRIGEHSFFVGESLDGVRVKSRASFD